MVVTKDGSHKNKMTAAKNKIWWPENLENGHLSHASFEMQVHAMARISGAYKILEEEKKYLLNLINTSPVKCNLQLY